MLNFLFYAAVMSIFAIAVVVALAVSTGVVPTKLNRANIVMASSIENVIKVANVAN